MRQSHRITQHVFSCLYFITANAAPIVGYQSRSMQMIFQSVVTRQALIVFFPDQVIVNLTYLIIQVYIFVSLPIPVGLLPVWLCRFIWPFIYCEARRLQQYFKEWYLQYSWLTLLSVHLLSHCLVIPTCPGAHLSVVFLCRQISFSRLRLSVSTLDLMLTTLIATIIDALLSDSMYVRWPLYFRRINFLAHISIASSSAW